MTGPRKWGSSTAMAWEPSGIRVGTEVPSSRSVVSATCLLKAMFAGVSSCTYSRSSVPVTGSEELIRSRCWTTAIT